MTEKEIKICLERMSIGKTSDVVNFDYAGTLEYIKRLEAENAELKDQWDNLRCVYSYNGDVMEYCVNGPCPHDRSVAKVREENKELRARLEKAVELKAKRLDVIYMPWVYDGNFGIATLQIIGIDLRTNGEIAYITNLESDSIIYLAKYSYGIFYNADFDHIVFTDRSKAEARLAELKGEKQ